MEADFCAQCNALFYTTDQTPTIVRSAIRRRLHLAPSMSNTAGIIRAKIYNAIVEQRLPPGTKLGEKSLWKIFGVSRTLIRRLANDQWWIRGRTAATCVACPAV